MTASVLDIADDLALHVDLDGMQMIEASAGTGKTFTIAGLYARLIVERKVPLREILVMTFTRAATEELRGRLRDRLALCASLADAPEAGADAPMPLDAGYEQRWALTLLRGARDAGEDAAGLSHRLHAALTGMDEARIFTIHGFCARVLAEHAAFLDGIVPGAELVPSDRDLLDDFAADFWLRVAGEDDPERLDALYALARTPTDLARMLTALVPFAGDIEPVPGALPAAADADAAWRQLLAIWNTRAEDAVAVFKRCFESGHLHGGKFKAGCVEQLQVLASRLGDGHRLDAKELGKFAGSYIAAAVNKSQPKFIGHEAFAAIDTWLEAEQSRSARRRGLVAGLLQRVVTEARTWLQQRKCALARLSYDDQVRHVDHGLRAGRSAEQLACSLREHFPYALVDEFQDTDARQFSILDRIYHGHKSLFMIGDPKQAIYGFRGGDVHAYLRAKELADGRSTLQYNFRSTPSMLAATEALFTTCSKDAFIENGIHFEPVRWGGRAVDDGFCIGKEPAPALTVWPLPPGANDKPLSAGDARAELTTGCAINIARLLAPGAASLHGKPLEAGSIAVLVNKNTEALAVLEALRECGVPAVCVQKTSVFDTVEAANLLLLLDALLVPQDMALARGALASEWLGRNLADFRAMTEDEAAWRAALQELSELRERWFGRGILAMIELLAEQHAPRLLALVDGERRLGNLLQLGDAMQDEARGRTGEHGLRDWLAMRIRDADRNNEEEQLRLESDAECVRIVTLHSAKGLEFDLVFLPFVATMGPRQLVRGKFARFHRDGGLVKRLILGDKEARTAAPVDSVLAGEEQAIAAARVEEGAEQVRLLYVGITRARHACWMSCGGKLARTGPLGHLLPDDEYCDALMTQPRLVVQRQALPAGDVTPVPPLVHEPLAGARTFTRVLQRDWWVHSFSRLAEGGRRDTLEDTGQAADEQGVPAPADLPLMAIEVAGWPRGARYGNAVHAILQRADFAAWRDADTVPDAERALLATQLRAAGYAADDEFGAAEANTANLVAAALNAPVLPGLRLADVTPANRRAELEFHFGMAGADPVQLLALLHQHGYQCHRRDFARLHGSLRGLMNGIIDLVFVHDGRWWIVDYKTNYLGPRWTDYAPAQLPAVIAAHDYDLQYLIYSVALHRWLRQVRGEDHDYERDMGGVRYLFLRGMARPDDSGSGTGGNGIFSDRPPLALIEALDVLLRAPGVVTT